MLKRTCPFGESFPNQMKTHVGQKEVAEGVDKEKHMKEVYDKTLAMMFAAQKQASKAEMNPATGTPASAPPLGTANGHHPENGGTLGKGAEDLHGDGCGSSHMELLPGQCLLDEHGKIIVGHTVSPKSKESQEAGPPRCCACCKPTAPDVVACCYSCRGRTCPGCLRLCLQCENGFCIMCSLINYDENCDRIFCLSCSSQME